jgi:hypothetical protein
MMSDVPVVHKHVQFLCILRSLDSALQYNQGRFEIPGRAAILSLFLTGVVSISGVSIRIPCLTWLSGNSVVELRTLFFSSLLSNE